MHAPTPWKVANVDRTTSPARFRSFLVDANGKEVDLTDRANLMLIALSVAAHHIRVEEENRRILNEQARAERFGYDTETCRANAAECGGL